MSIAKGRILEVGLLKVQKRSLNDHKSSLA